MKKYKVLFIDLDDTLIHTIKGIGFPQGVYDMVLDFDVLMSIRSFGVERVFIATNQGGISKGYVDRPNFVAKVQYVCACIRDFCKSVKSCEALFCADMETCNKFRKPNAGMLEWLHDVYAKDVPKEDCIMVGDASGKPGQYSDVDKKTAENYGIDYMDVTDFIEAFNHEPLNESPNADSPRGYYIH